MISFKSNGHYYTLRGTRPTYTSAIHFAYWLNDKYNSRYKIKRINNGYAVYATGF